MDDFEAPTIQGGIGRIGRYSLLAELAQGGMARVFLARKDGAPQPCVLKQLHVELEHHPTAARRFQREANIVAHLDHPGIARVLGAGPEDGRFCIALEYVSGQTLEAILERSRSRGRAIPVDVALFIVDQLLDALTYAHGLADTEGHPLGLVHRDLSPGNVMLGYDGRAKLIDFGVARARFDDFRTSPGMMVGTLRYMAPEQASTGAIDHRADLYAVGAVGFELLTGRPLVERGAPGSVYAAVLEAKPRSIRQLRPEVPVAVDEVFAWALSRSPSDRPADAQTLRSALRDASSSLARARPLHASHYMGQLFPDEELAEARLADHPLSPFGALQTEDLPPELDVRRPSLEPRLLEARPTEPGPDEDSSSEPEPLVRPVIPSEPLDEPEASDPWPPSIVVRAPPGEDGQQERLSLRVRRLERAVLVLGLATALLTLLLLLR